MSGFFKVPQVSLGLPYGHQGFQDFSGFLMVPKGFLGFYSFLGFL